MSDAELLEQARQLSNAFKAEAVREGELYAAYIIAPNGDYIKASDPDRETAQQKILDKLK